VDSRWRQLNNLAKRQYGHFTTRQAEDAGLTRPALHYQLKEGLVTRPERGVYRFTTFPPSDYEREAILILWSRRKKGVALSHETALSHFELGDVFPSKYHLTVPKGFRMKPPRDVILHKTELDPKDVHEEDVLRYTTPTRTILDLVKDDYPVEQLQAAYKQALSKGLVRRQALSVNSHQVLRYLKHLPLSRQAELVDRLIWVTGGD
jgi:predicted transcriptional regulator of viral defense system